MTDFKMFSYLLILGSIHFVFAINVKLNCPDTRPSTTRPTSVHKLRPGDIEAVGAMGDSITAGFAMKSNSIVNVFIEWRGLSFSAGGDSSLDNGIATIPNILKKFNPYIYGYSKYSGLLGFPPAERNFNVALTGAKSNDALRQAKNLVSRMKSRMRRFFDVQWKLVTIFIGQNDHCDHCYFNGTIDGFIEKYEKQMREGLDYLHQNLPRALVQILGIVNPTKFFTHPRVVNNPVCRAIHDYTCDCITDEDNLEESNEAHSKINTVLRSVAASGRYDTRQDFTVVYQPTLSGADLPKKPNSDEYDLSFMGHDCFHPNDRLHAIFSAELWNSMLIPVSQKIPQSIIPREEYTLVCPTRENPYIATNFNDNTYTK